MLRYIRVTFSVWSESILGRINELSSFHMMNNYAMDDPPDYCAGRAHGSGGLFKFLYGVRRLQRPVSSLSMRSVTLHRSMSGYRIIEASAKEFLHGGYFKDEARHARLGAVGVLRGCYSVERMIARNSVCSRNSPQPCLDPPNQNGTMAKGRKYGLLNDMKRWRSCSAVPRGCLYSIRLWPLRRDDHSGVLIGAGGERHSDWPAHVLDI